MKTVCIIGGGFCGTMTAIHLLQKSDSITVRIISQGQPLAKGVAYSTNRMEHLLNVPAGKMSAFADIPSHFTDWLKNSVYQDALPENLSQSFLPRFFYGKYLEDLTKDFLKNERLGIISSRAVGVQLSGGKYQVATEGKTIVEADYLVLAPGNYLPAAPKIDGLTSPGDDRYFPDPWSTDFLEKIRKEENILLVGSGLTMVDCVLSLQVNGFKGTIYSVSPRGYLPEQHAEQVISYPDFYNELKGKNLQEIFKTIRLHLLKAKEKNIPWQSVIDGVRPYTKEIWAALSQKDKQQFISHLRHIWGVARHRLPLNTHAEIRSLLESGQLKVIGGRLQSISSQQDFAEAVIKSRGSQERCTLKISAIVNCTGPQINYNEVNDPLIKSLLRNNLICGDDLKMGIKASLSGNVLNAEEKPVPNVYAVGSLLRGLLWETTAVPELRENAENVAGQIIGSIN